MTVNDFELIPNVQNFMLLIFKTVAGLTDPYSLIFSAVSFDLR